MTLIVEYIILPGILSVGIIEILGLFHVKDLSKDYISSVLASIGILKSDLEDDVKQKELLLICHQLLISLTKIVFLLLTISLYCFLCLYVANLHNSINSLELTYDWVFLLTLSIIGFLYYVIVSE